MSSDATPRLGLPDMPETPELYPDIVADAFTRLDAFTDLYLKGQFVNTPPATPADGDAYLTGGSPTGAWSGQPYKIAACRDGAWTMLVPFNGLRAFVTGVDRFILYRDGAWIDWTSLIGANEGSIAASATCDIGAAGSLCVAVTGTTAITSLGTAANKLRVLRFAGALTLTHHAAGLILPGAANIVTQAGDTAIFTSDGSGNWRCRAYTRADGRMVNMASPTFPGTTILDGGASAQVAHFASSHADGPYIRFVRAGIGTTGFLGSARNIISGTLSADSMAIAGNGGPLYLSGTSLHGMVGAAEAWRTGSDGSLLVGTTVNAGPGAIAADYFVPRLLAFAGLPPSPPNGARAMISDGSVTAFRAAAAGGGAAVVPVHYVAGSGWLVG